METCKILTKIRRIPVIFEKYLRDSDILFRAQGLYVLVDNDNDLDKPYDFIDGLDAIRLDKRVLKELTDAELSVILHQAKIEKELTLIFYNEKSLLDELDFVISSRYDYNLLQVINLKIEKIFNNV